MDIRQQITIARRELMPWLGPIQARNVRIVSSDLRHLNDVEVDGSTKDVLTQMGWHHLRTFHTELFGKSQSFEVFEEFGDGWDREAYPNCTKYRTWSEPGIVITAPDHNSNFVTNIYTSDDAVLTQFLPPKHDVENIGTDADTSASEIDDVVMSPAKKPETHRVSKRVVASTGAGYGR